MYKKIINWGLVIGGALLLEISLLADLIGLGSHWGFNWAQITGSVVGLAALIVGIILFSKKGTQ